MLSQYLAREPAPDERIEYAVAQLAAMYANAHRGKGKPPYKITDFMLFRNAWKTEQEATLSEIIESFGGVSRADNHR